MNEYDAIIPAGEEGNDLEPALSAQEVMEEPETWLEQAGDPPVETNPPDWLDQRRPVTEDPFDDDGWTDAP